MSRPKVYVDSCVLVHAASAKKEEEITKRAIAALDRDDVDFMFSPIVELETMPTPMRNPQHRYQVKIFEAYFSDFIKVPCDERAQEISIKEAGSGNGLGLAIVDSIVKAHHGWVGAESADGHTTFRVRLPLIE